MLIEYTNAISFQYHFCTEELKGKYCDPYSEVSNTTGALNSTSYNTYNIDFLIIVHNIVILNCVP